MTNKKNLSRLTANSLSFSLIALLGAQATHKPGDFPSPPWPPHSHIEVAPVVSSTVMKITAGDAVVFIGPNRSVSLTGQAMTAEQGYFQPGVSVEL
jgi:hypothetical protein